MGPCAGAAFSARAAHVESSTEVVDDGDSGVALLRLLHEASCQCDATVLTRGYCGLEKNVDFSLQSFAHCLLFFPAEQLDLTDRFFFLHSIG